MPSLSALLLLAGLLELPTFLNASPVPNVLRKSSAAPQTMRMALSKPAPKRIVRRQGGTLTTGLGISEDQSSYNIVADVGNPAQSVTVQLDTGSSDFWVLAPGACDTDTCTCPQEGCTYFDPTLSTSAVSYDGIAGEFDASYGSGEAVGSYYTDDVNVGGALLTDVIIAVATSDTTEPRGIMGVGLPAGESDGIAEHPGIVEVLYNQGFITSNSYSLYLDSFASGSGEIIFGGYDSSLYSGDLVALPIVASPDGSPRLTVEWDTLAIQQGGSTVYDSSQADTTLSTGPAVLLDSGTTLAEVPQDIFNAMESAFGLTFNSADSIWLGDCSIASSDAQLVFGFGGGQVSITVPASEIMRPFDGSDSCLFGFQPTTSELNILGDVFLTSAYVLYDFDAYTISMAPAVWT